MENEEEEEEEEEEGVDCNCASRVQAHPTVDQTCSRTPESIGATGVDRSESEYSGVNRSTSESIGVIQSGSEYAGVDGAPELNPEFYRNQSWFSKPGVRVDS
uniref:Uncharacterized protein n=1 Tax=Anopheles culicifacies TaxID=139723 RepID=A0A182MES5_9DIPT